MLRRRLLRLAKEDRVAFDALVRLVKAASRTTPRTSKKVYNS